MQQIGKGAARIFKSLAGLDRDAPLTSYTIALYLCLLLVAVTLLALWAVGWPSE